jgi:hypothetical protein
MKISDVKMMVITSKLTKDWTEKIAYLAPDGRCTNSLRYATELWCRELGVKFSITEYVG